tara:strand:+ start:352 stop:699 length:348 start_codon:yes stop_codon:yes gene_type:complete
MGKKISMILYLSLAFWLMTDPVVLRAEEEFELGKYVKESFLQTKLKAMGLRWVNDVDNINKTNFRHFGKYELNENVDFMYGYKSADLQDDFLDAELIMFQFEYNYEKNLSSTFDE